MKNILLIFLILSFSSLIAQEELYKRELPLNDDNRIEFEEIIEIPNKTKTDLYLLSKTWIIENYNSANDVIQMDDKEAGKIISKGIYSYLQYGIDYKLHHILKIYTKDGKVKINLSSLYFHYSFMDAKAETPIRELIIDGLYKKNGKVNMGSKEHKEKLILFWESTKNSIINELNNKADDEDDW